MSARSLLKCISGVGAAALIAAVTGIAPAQAGTDPGSSVRSAIAGTLDPAPRVHLMPTRSVARSMSRSAGVAASPPVHLAYFGGPVMYAGTQTIPIFWEPPALQDGTPEAVDPHYNELIQRFLEDVGGHGLYNNLTQYYQVVGGHKRYIVNSSGFLQAILDTTAYPPAAGSCAANSLANCITDTQIQTEIANVVTAGSLPIGYSTMYMVFTDPLEASCVDDTSCFDPVPPETNWKYCAYHSAFFSGGQPVIYANMPYLASNAASISGCAGGASHPNNVAFDDETSALSHEFNEAITDPIPDDFDLAWYDLNYGEIGDICNQETARVTWGSNTYIVQKEWSNATNSCVPGGDNRLSLIVKSGPAGAPTKARGRGFLPAKTVTLSFSDSHGKRTGLGSAKSNGSGAFLKAVMIPGGAPDGKGTLGATGANPGDGASAGFSVVPPVSTYRPDALIALTGMGTVDRRQDLQRHGLGPNPSSQRDARQVRDLVGQDPEPRQRGGHVHPEWAVGPGGLHGRLRGRLQHQDRSGRGGHIRQDPGVGRLLPHQGDGAGEGIGRRGGVLP